MTTSCRMTTIPTSAKQILLYYSTWNQDAFPPSMIDMSVVTTVAYSFALLTYPNGTLTYDYGYNPDELIATAHAAGRKVILAIRNQDQYDYTGYVDKFLADPVAQGLFINDIIKEINNRGFDGVDSDIELFTDINGFTAFQIRLATAVRANNPNHKLHLPFMASIGNIVSRFDLSALDPYVDYFMMMGYDWYGWWPPWIAGPNSPNLVDSASNPPWVGGTGNYNTLSYLIKTATIDPKKLIYGVPTYGRLYRVVNDVRLAPMTTGVTSDFPYSPVDILGYTDYINLTTSGVGTLHYDSIWQTYYLSYSGGRLENPGFEINDYGWVKRQTIVADGTPEPATGHDPHSSEYSHSGLDGGIGGSGYSGKITGGGIDGRSRFYQQYVHDVGAGNSYTVSCWIKGVGISSSDIWSGGATFKITYYGFKSIGGNPPIDNQWLSSENIVFDLNLDKLGDLSYIQGTFDWTQLLWTITTPANTTYIGFEISIDNAYGDVYFDDCVFDFAYGIVNKQLHFDNVETYRLKFNHAIDLGLAGIGMWEASMIGSSTDIWTVLKDYFQ